MADSNSLNKFQILGFVGKDPELIQCRDPGRKFCIIDIATQEKYKGRDTPRVTWHYIQVWGTMLAPWCSTNVKKGMQICVEGKISRRKFTYYTRDGKEEYIMVADFKAETVTKLYQKKNSNEPQDQEPAPDPQPDQQQDPY